MQLVTTLPLVLPVPASDNLPMSKAATKPSPTRASSNAVPNQKPRPAARKAAPAKKPASKARPKPTGALAPPAHVDLKIDRELKQQWDKALSAVQASRREGAAAFDELWETVAEVLEHDPPLYLAGGLATAKAFLTTHLGETERTAYRNIRVAKYASPAEEARYGVAKLDLVLGYIEAKLGGAPRGRVPVDFASVKIPVERGGQPRKVAIEAATAKEIAAATRILTRAANKPPARTPPVVAAITKALSKGPLRTVTVRLSNGKLSLGGIPAASFPDLLRALSAMEMPGL